MSNKKLKIVVLMLFISLFTSSCFIYDNYQFPKCKRANGQLTCVGAYIAEYRDIAGRYPADLDHFSPIPESSDRYSLLKYCYSWQPEKVMLPDPWGEPFMYWSDGSNYVFWSKGADRHTDTVWLKGLNENWRQDTVVVNGHTMLFKLPAATPLLYSTEPYDVVVEKFPALAAAARKAHGIVDLKSEE